MLLTYIRQDIHDATSWLIESSACALTWLAKALIFATKGEYGGT